MPAGVQASRFNQTNLTIGVFRPSRIDDCPRVPSADDNIVKVIHQAVIRLLSATSLLRISPRIDRLVCSFIKCPHRQRKAIAYAAEHHTHTAADADPLDEFGRREFAIGRH